MGRIALLAVTLAIGAIAVQFAWPGHASADPGDGLLGGLGGVTETLAEPLDTATQITEDLTAPVTTDTDAANADEPQGPLGGAGETVSMVSESLSDAIAPVTEAAGEAVAPAGATAGEVVQPLTTSVTETLGPVMQVVETVAEPLAGPIEQSAAGLEPALDAVAPLVGPLTLAGETVAPLAEPLSPALNVIEPVTDALQPAVEPVVDALQPVVGPLTEAIAPVLQPVIETVQPVLDPVLETTTPVTGPIDEVLDPVLNPPELPGPVAGPLPLPDLPGPVDSPLPLPGPDPSPVPAPIADQPAPVPARHVPSPVTGPSAAIVRDIGRVEHGLTRLGADEAGATLSAVFDDPAIPAGPDAGGEPTVAGRALEAGPADAGTFGAASLPLPAPALAFEGLDPGGTPVFSGPVRVHAPAAELPASPLSLTAETSSSGSVPRFDWPSASLPIGLLGLLAAGVLVVLAGASAQPRSWQSRPYTPPA